MCVWRKMEQISWTDRVGNEGVLHTVKEGRSILRKIKWRNLNWTGHRLLWNCVLKHFIFRRIEVKTEGTRRQGIRHKQLLDDLKKNRRYWNLKQTTLDRIVWRTYWGRSHGPVVNRLRNERMHKLTDCSLKYLWSGLRVKTQDIRCRCRTLLNK
jgi:hypothetical protein